MDKPEQYYDTLLDEKYRLVNFLGEGGYGCVFEAHEELLGAYVARVAVKIIPLAGDDGAAAKAMHNEIAGLASLRHDNIIRYSFSNVIQKGPLAGAVYMVTELGETSLARELQRTPELHRDELLAMSQGITAALAYLHGHRALHRDVKPANILKVEGRWKLADFGLLERVTVGERADVRQGTLCYMAPEVLDGTWTPASDVYSFGVTLLECLTGDYAHDGADPATFVENLRHVPPRVPRHLTSPWDRIVQACLQRSPAARPSAQDLVTMLAQANVPASSAALGASVAPTAAQLVVSSLGGGEHSSIGEAIRRAAPGTRIVVRPGHYRETLVLDKPVEIVGSGPQQEIIVEAVDSHVIEAVAGQAVVRGLTLRSRSTHTDVECYAVEVTGGRLILEQCEVSAEGAACVAVHGPSSAAILSACRLHGSRDVGVFAYDRSNVRLEDCQIFGNAKSALAVGESARATLVRCRMYEGQASGVHVFRDGRANLEDCQIWNHPKMGVAINEGGEAVLVRCRVHENALYAVWCQGNAVARLTECDLQGNGRGECQACEGAHIEHAAATT